MTYPNGDFIFRMRLEKDVVLVDFEQGDKSKFALLYQNGKRMVSFQKGVNIRARENDRIMIVSNRVHEKLMTSQSKQVLQRAVQKYKDFIFHTIIRVRN